MKICLFTLLSFLLVCLFGISSSERNAMAIEESKYEIMENAEDFELRQYHPHVVAETFVEGNFDEVGNEGFRRLAAYINGKNRKRESISMTALVSQEATSEKIAMTAPVSQEKSGGLWRITFLMPSK